VETQGQLTACRESEPQSKARLAVPRKWSTAIDRGIAARGEQSEYFSAVEIARDQRPRKRLKAERQAALGGTFIQDGTGAPFAQQERSSLLLSKQERERELLDARSKMEQLGAEISALRTHVDSPSTMISICQAAISFGPISPVPVRLSWKGSPSWNWRTAGTLSWWSSFRSGTRLHNGWRCGYHPSGRENEWRRGEVSRVRGSAARRDERFSPRGARPQDNYIMVEIALSEDDKPMEINHACNIGRLAEVRLERSFLPLISWFSPSRSPAASHLHPAGLQKPSAT